jgi:hypothetical protein
VYKRALFVYGGRFDGARYREALSRCASMWKWQSHHVRLVLERERT